MTLTGYKMPVEVLEMIGYDTLPWENPIAYNVTLSSLDQMYREQGLQWIVDNVLLLRDSIGYLKTPC